MHYVATDVAYSLVCLYGMLTHVGPRNHVWGSRSPTGWGWGNFG